MVKSDSKAVFQLSKRYPQLALPIQADMRSTTEYKDTVLRGKPVLREPAFIGSPEDRLSRYDTPAGPVDALYLAEREDFEHALRALAYRCEPVEILPSVGASTVSGLINWEKIHRHRDAWLAAGDQDWSAEFKRFTADKANYLDTLLLLSSGNYSAVPADDVGLSQEEWLDKSLTIRTYHELTHFVCRKLYPDDRDAIRDEVLADAMGLTAAFGSYDPGLAKRFLGIDGESPREGARITHYVEPQELPAAVTQARQWIAHYDARLRGAPASEIFELLLRVFP